MVTVEFLATLGVPSAQTEEGSAAPFKKMYVAKRANLYAGPSTPHQLGNLLNVEERISVASNVSN